MKASAFTVAVFFACAAASQAAMIGPEDAYKLVSVGEPVFSPDGTKLVSIQGRVDVAGDKRRSTLVITDIAAKTSRNLTVDRRGLAEPQFAPGGDAIAFIAEDAQKHEQVFLMPLDGGDARALTKTKEGVQQFAWRPDGDAIAYVTTDANPKKAAIAKHHDFFDLANDDYLGREYAPPSHIWLVSRAGTNDHRLTSGPWSLASSYPPSPPASPLSWSPDGASLLFTRVPDTRDGDAYRSQIMRLDVATKAVTPVTGHDRFEGYAQYSPDGSKIAYLYSRDGDPNNENDVFIMDASGKNDVDVSKTLDRSIFRAQWLPDGKSLLVGAHDGTRTFLWHLALDGTFARIPTGDVNPVNFFWMNNALARDGRIAFVASESTHPNELYLVDKDGGTPKKISDLNGAIAGRELGAASVVTYENDGFKQSGILTHPPHEVAGKKYPLVLYVHGGPTASSNTSFEFFSQALAAHGWLVFEPNYRGSDNAGNAYQRAVYMDAGAGPGRDVMAGVAAVEKLGIVDTSRMAVSGWSYGGYMTSWLMSHYHVWRTAISGAAVNNWVDMYNLGDGNFQIGFEFKGSPYVGNNMADYRAQSPLTYAAQTTCPVLVISDVGDVRVPISQSFEMYHALADNHIPVRFVGIPVDGHYPSDPIRQRDLLVLWGSWLADHLQ